MAKNITKVYLLDVPLESDYKNTLYFNSLSGQQTYFQSRIVKSYTDFSYQRKDHIIRIPEEYDEIYNVNYVMYQNSAYSNKWFYAFIKDLRYVNDGMTEAVIETDVIQTWMFDYTVKSSFVEREHTSNDTIGSNTVPEGLETGEYVTQVKSESSQQTRNLHYLATKWIIVAISDWPDVAIAVGGQGKTYNGVYSGLYYLVFPSSLDVDNFIRGMQAKTAQDLIYSVFMVPRNLIELAAADFTSTTYGGYTFSYAFYPYTQSAYDMGSIGINNDHFLDQDYTPRNNKLLTYPYRYLLISNNAGSAKEYQYELFNNTSVCTFTLKGAVTPGCSIRLVPDDYNQGNEISGLDAGKLPTCSWFTDPYTNWLTQNAINIPFDLFTGASAIATGALVAGTGNLAVGGAMMAGGVAGVTRQVSEIYQHSKIPLSAKGGVNQGDYTFASGLTFNYYKMSIKKEYAQIIDGYFDMFGYKVNRVKVPNTHHRSRWWYTKCVDVSIDGNIPGDHIQKIKDCYNNGIRFWRNASEIENYSLSNGISNIV